MPQNATEERVDEEAEYLSDANGTRPCEDKARAGRRTESNPRAGNRTGLRSQSHDERR